MSFLTALGLCRNWLIENRSSRYSESMILGLNIQSSSDGPISSDLLIVTKLSRLGRRVWSLASTPPSTSSLTSSPLAGGPWGSRERLITFSNLSLIGALAWFDTFVPPSNHAVSFVAQRYPNLEVLSIKCCPNVTDSSMADIAFPCPMIQELDISYCHEISHESLVLIGRNCPNLKILKRNLMKRLDCFEPAGVVPDEYLKTCPQDGNSEAAAIGKSMPNLEHLELRFSKVSAKGVALISVGCPNLEYLDLFGCVNLTSREIENATSNLKNLKEILQCKKNPKYLHPQVSVPYREALEAV